jgi:hypothetical protein
MVLRRISAEIGLGEIGISQHLSGFYTSMSAGEAGTIGVQGGGKEEE